METTRLWRVLGSVWYMSPEQASMDSQQVDTRTDVYSLGVVLYQLLVDTIPLDKNSLANKSIRDILLAIQSDVPLAPSNQLESGSRLKSLLAARQTEYSAFASSLKDDLDWIVLRALKKNPEERYATVSELAADVQRFLNNEVVVARPVSRWHALKKMCRRNRLTFFLAATLGLAMIIGGGVATWGVLRIIKAESESTARFAQTKKANEILTNIFSDLEIGTFESSGEPYKIQVAKRMIAAAKLLEGESVGDPLEVAAMQVKLANSLLSLGFPEDAVTISQDAYAVSNRIAGIDHELTRQSGLTLAFALYNSGENRSAQETLNPILAYCQNRTDTKDPEWLRTNRLQARLWYAIGENDKSLDLYQQIVEIKEQLFGTNAIETVLARRDLSDVLISNKDSTRAIPMIEEVVKQCRKQLPGGHPRLINAISSLGWAYGMSSNRQAGEAFSQEAYELAVETYGEHHQEAYSALQMIGLTAYSLNEFERSEQCLSKAITGLTETSGIDHPRTQMAILLLGRMYQESGDLKRALPMMELTVQSTRKKYPSSPKLVRFRLNELASIYSLCGYSAKAESLSQECIELCDGELTRESLVFVRDLGRIYLNDKQHEKAIECFQKSFEGLAAISNQFDFDAVLAKVFWANALGDQGNHDNAIEVLRPYFEALANEMGRENRATVLVSAQLALNLQSDGKPEEAISLLEAVLETGIQLKRMDWLRQGLRKSYLAVFDMEKLYHSINREREVLRRDMGQGLLGSRLLKLGRETFDLGLVEKAEEILLESATVLEDASENSWEHRMVELQLARIQLAQGDVDIAVSNLDSAFSGLAELIEDALPVEVQDLAETVGQIAKSFSDLSLEEESKKWNARLNSL